MEFNPRRRTKPEDFDDLAPSKVIHVRDLAEHTLEIDITHSFEIFGAIKDVVMIPKKRQALIEFVNLNSAQDIVRNYRNDHIMIGGKPAKVNFSTSDHVVKRSGPGENCKENKVLIFFIYNAVYPINVDVILKITRPHGRVARIFINRKAAALHALVEFITLEEAVMTKRNLNGADIYSGCCTLKIEFATTDRVNIQYNSEDTYDYELSIAEKMGPSSLLGVPNGSMGYQTRNPPLIKEADGRDLSGYDARTGYMQEYAQQPQTAADYRAMTAEYQRMTDTRMMPQMPATDRGYMTPYDDMSGMMAASMMEAPRVAMVYGVNMQSMNCQRLFNLLCLYGNVEKVKFLKSKEGSAMVQMGDGTAVERLMHLLHNSALFGDCIQFQISKQPIINNVQAPYTLPDGTDSFQDFVRCKENRFSTPEFASKNRVFAPSRTLNFWNAPPSFTLEQIKEQFVTLGVKEPEEFFQLTNREKSSSGLIQWSNVEDAVNAVAVCNHIMLTHDDAKYPYQLKLSFSESPIRARAEGETGERGDLKRIRPPGSGPAIKRGRY